MKDEKLSRKERERLRQRQDILNAAFDLFTEKGYHSVSMHEIAEKAEFAIGTLYKFFQSKEELYTALVLAKCGTFEELAEQVLGASNDPVAQLRAYTETKGKWIRDNLPFVRLFVSERSKATFNFKADLNEVLRRRYCEFLEKLATVFEAGIKSGRFRNFSDPYHLALALDSVIDAFLFLWLDAPDRYAYPANPDDVLNIFFKGLVESDAQHGL